MDVQRLEVLLLRGLDRGEGFDGVIRGDREDESLEVRSSVWPERPTLWMRDVT